MKGTIDQVVEEARSEGREAKPAEEAESEEDERADTEKRGVNRTPSAWPTTGTLSMPRC